jgi:hypothetical protein
MSKDVKICAPKENKKKASKRKLPKEHMVYDKITKPIVLTRF